MRVYLGFDDTDNPESDFGTGKVARRYEALLPAGCRLWGVVRQQLLVDPRIPYTSHNSSACAILDLPGEECDEPLMEALLQRAAAHIEGMSSPGSDPGLCLAAAGDPALPALMELGRSCTRRLVTQAEALAAAGRAHLSGHGGTCDGIIGAAAAVGLTAAGWSGRFIEYASLRSLPDPVAVSTLEERGIRVVSLDRDALVPGPEDLVHTHGWLRPRLWGSVPVLPMVPAAPGAWESIGEKRPKQKQ
jgi:tRNA(Ile2) C34 agmatinyltransferase TiaS